MSEEHRNALGAALLAELARDPASSCANEFQALFYEFIWRRLRNHQDRLARRVARYLDTDGPVAPRLQEQEIDEVAHDATARALRRVCQNASAFDPKRGTATNWVIGASEFAFIEVAKEAVRARNPEGIGFASNDALDSLIDPSPGTEEIVLAEMSSGQVLREAAEILSEREWQALRLVITERYTHAEVAMIIFGTPTFTKQVDGLLTRGKKKLREAWAERRPDSRAAGASNVSPETDDMEGSDE